MGSVGRLGVCVAFGGCLVNDVFYQRIYCIISVLRVLTGIRSKNWKLAKQFICFHKGPFKSFNSHGGTEFQTPPSFIMTTNINDLILPDSASKSIRNRFKAEKKQGDIDCDISCDFIQPSNRRGCVERTG